MHFLSRFQNVRSRGQRGYVIALPHIRTTRWLLRTLGVLVASTLHLRGLSFGRFSPSYEQLIKCVRLLLRVQACARARVTVSPV